MTMQVTSVVPRDGITMNEAVLMGRSADRLASYRAAKRSLAASAVGNKYAFRMNGEDLTLTLPGARAVMDLLIEREVSFLSNLGVSDAAGS